MSKVELSRVEGRSAEEAGRGFSGILAASSCPMP